MQTLPLTDVAYPFLTAPNIETLEEVWVCEDYEPNMTSGGRTRYKNVAAVVLIPGQLYVLPEAHHDLRGGQYLVHNEWLQEELELDEPLFMLYNDLGDFVTGSVHAKNKYAFVKVPDLMQLGRYAQTIVWQAFAGPIEHETALEVENFVLAHATVVDQDLRDALDWLYLMVSDEDTKRKNNRRRKALMGRAAMDRVAEVMARVGESHLLIESRLAVALDRHRQIIDQLTQLKSVVKSRLDTKLDTARLAHYAEELETEARQLLTIVDRPFVGVVGHLRRELLGAAKCFRFDGDHAEEAIRSAYMELTTSYKVLEFILTVYPRLFELRLQMAGLIDEKKPLSDRDRFDFLFEIDQIIFLANKHNCDKRLVGGKLAEPVFTYLHEARDHIARSETSLAYRAIKNGTKRAA